MKHFLEYVTTNFLGITTATLILVPAGIIICIIAAVIQDRIKKFIKKRKEKRK